MATHKPMANAAEESKTRVRSRTGAEEARWFVCCRRTVHEEPVPGQNPDQHQHDGEREGEELGQGEASAAAEGNPAGRRIRDISTVQLQPNTLTNIRPIQMCVEQRLEQVFRRPETPWLQVIPQQ